jgi:signal transduction histidine kinase
MRYFERWRALFGVAGFGFMLSLALIVGAVESASLLHAQTSAAITNLAQLTQAMSREHQMVADIRLEATVFACETNSGVMILQDSSGAELLELDGLKAEFRSGDRVRIESGSCFLSSSDLGIYISAAPLLNNDGLHSARTISRERFFEAGRYPLRLDWFNQFSAFMLEVSCVATNSEGQSLAGAPAETTNLIHAVRAECYQGFWSRLPNFQLLQPIQVGRITNFDIACRTRDDMVGIRFEGFFDAPRTGNYLFSLRSDDGSRLWVGTPEVPVRRIGTNAPPLAPLAFIGEPMTSLNDRRLSTIEGRISFVSRFGKGLRFEMRSEQNSISVAMAGAGDLEPADLLNAYVIVSGVAEGVLTENRRVVLGKLAVASAKELAFVEKAPGKGTLPTLLKTVMHVHSLSRDAAAHQLPVTIRGVVTAVGQPLGRWMVVQDDTRGTFIGLRLVTNCFPNVGDVWSIAGRTEPGDFAPVILAEQATFLGTGRLPEPAHLTWNQLMNGSMDVQWVELEGVVTGVQSNRLSLLLPEGHQEINMPEWGESELKAFDKAVVRIRGALFAVWNAETHEVRRGSILMHNASLTVAKPAPVDPFDAPEKTPRGLFHFDAKATPFQRVKVLGQVTYVDSKRVFIEQGIGIQILPAARVKLRIGDWVEAVGYPEISGASPLLREALARKTSEGVLPEATLVSDSELGKEHFASMRIRIEGILAGQHTEEDTLVLHIQIPSHLFLARVANAGSLRPLRLGSKLSLTGIYVSDARQGAPSSEASQFELLLNAPSDVAVISVPSWWTLQRLLSAMGALLGTLALAAVWIALLRRQVAQRTLQLQHEIRERERAERKHALEAERTRIARDLHDDLGSSLTEINVLASTGQRPRSGRDTHPALFKAISERARALIAALDVIVWAVDPEDNSLQSLADYLSGYTREYLSNSSVVCRFKIPVILPTATLDGQIRHEVLMVVKETLNNIVRHADATEVEFQMNLADDTLGICISDNGKGFDPNTEAGGHGLKNRLARVTKIGGSCLVESNAGMGTTVRIRLPILPTSTGRSEEANTTFG